MGVVLFTPADYRDRALRSLGNLPPFSPILNKLLASLAQEDVSFAKLAELIEKDTVMAGNVLRLVNSALYGRRGTINSVRHAVSLMGVVRLRNSAMTLSVSWMWSKVKTPTGWSSAKFNLHAVAVAIMSDLLAQKVPVNYPEGAFVAGLLHDIGLLLIAIGLQKEYEEIRQHLDKGYGTIYDCEKEVIGLDHAELSAVALAKWNLPEPIQKAVQHHHEPLPLSGDEFPLSKVLQVADRVVELEGVTLFHNSHEPEESSEEVLSQLGLGSEAGGITEEFETEFEAIRDFF